jgi:hypothetical protein
MQLKGLHARVAVTSARQQAGISLRKPRAGERSSSAAQRSRCKVVSVIYVTHVIYWNPVVNSGLFASRNPPIGPNTMRRLSHMSLQSQQSQTVNRLNTGAQGCLQTNDFKLRTISRFQCSLLCITCHFAGKTGKKHTRNLNPLAHAPSTGTELQRRLATH